METRDVVILLLALVVVVVMALVVKPMLTGTTPDLSLPFQPTPTPVPTATPDLPEWARAMNNPSSGTPVSTTNPVKTPTPGSTPGYPSASFSASPRSGPVPLPVRFTDTSAGVPTEWAWSFGDETGSVEENPVHVYATAGLFQVSLNVKNSFGANTRIVQGYINVTPSVGMDMLVEADRGGEVAPGGFLEWTVSSPGARMKIGGQLQDFDPGDRVRLVADSGGKGKISVYTRAILGFSFDEVSLYRNGQHVASGSVQEISIPQAEGFSSGILLTIPSGSGTVRILKEGFLQPGPSEGSEIFLGSLGPGADGTMNLDCFRPDYTYFRGTGNLVVA